MNARANLSQRLLLSAAIAWLLSLGLSVGVVMGTSAIAHAAETGFEGPDVTIIAEPDRTVYEYRQNGVLRMIRVVPEVGPPYFLVPEDPTRGDGDLERAERLLPSWVILRF